MLKLGDGAHQAHVTSDVLVDNEGKVILSDADVERIAQRVVSFPSSPLRFSVRRLGGGDYLVYGLGDEGHAVSLNGSHQAIADFLNNVLQ